MNNLVQRLTIGSTHRYEFCEKIGGQPVEMIKWVSIVVPRRNQS